MKTKITIPQSEFLIREMFNEVYEQQGYMDTNISKRRYVGNMNDRECKFCGTTDSKKFKSDAHFHNNRHANKLILPFFLATVMLNCL
jgi:hypothetical protein